MSVIIIDGHEVELLELDLAGAPARIKTEARKGIKRGADWVADGMRHDAAGHRYLRHLPTSVSWEFKGELWAEIGLGPKKGTQGSLAHIIAYGSVNNAPVYDYTAALRRNTPLIEHLFSDIAEGAVLGDD